MWYGVEGGRVAANLEPGMLQAYMDPSVQHRKEFGTSDLKFTAGQPNEALEAEKTLASSCIV